MRVSRHLVPLFALVFAVAACTSGAPPTSPPATAPPTVAPTEQPTVTPLPSPEPAAVREIRSERERAPSDDVSPEALRAVVAADAAFAFDLYREFATIEAGNFFFSPYSISTALSMTWAGARERTAEQLAAALGIDIEPDAWHAARNAIELGLLAPRRTIDDLLPITIEPTNASFGQDGFPFERAYLDTLAVYYGAGLQAVDFATQPEPVRQAINAWVSERTRERIGELLPQGSITDLTRLVLVNAIFFKANWIHQFDPGLTEDGDFSLLGGTTIQVPTMHGGLRTDYAAGNDWQAVRLPYAGDASMIVIVPDAGRFAEVEADLDADFVEGVRGQLSDHQVNLGLPRWESATQIDLRQPLEALGITDMFDWELANLDGIAPVEDLYVSDALHQANITVDEEGTEAAAATAIIAGITSAPPSVTLSVDRPFVYLIVDDLTTEILFVGRVLDPSGG